MTSTVPTPDPPSPARQTAKKTGGLVALGLTACLACCAGPVLAFLGGLTILSVASTLVFGLAGAAGAAVVVVAFVAMGRRRRAAHDSGTGSEPVPVGLTTRR